MIDAIINAVMPSSPAVWGKHQYLKTPSQQRIVNGRRIYIEQSKPSNPENGHRSHQPEDRQSRQFYWEEVSSLYHKNSCFGKFTESMIDAITDAVMPSSPAVWGKHQYIETPSQQRIANGRRIAENYIVRSKPPNAELENWPQSHQLEEMGTKPTENGEWWG
jgi:hypothetical protein